MNPVWRWVRAHPIWTLLIGAFIIVTISSAAGSSGGKSAGKFTTPDVPQSPSPVTSPAFPPRTFAQLAADATPGVVYSQIATSPIGVGTCTGDRVVITVPRHATGRQIVSAMATVYVQHGMADQGTAVVFAYYNARDNGKLPYTAGRIQVDSPCDGTTPRTVEVDVGNSIGAETTHMITQ